MLIFSHGGGVDRSFYTSQYEDLASHGYVVAAIARTYDTHLVVLPDGRVVRAAPAFHDALPVDSTLPRWRSDLERERRSQAHLWRVMDVAAADIRFVIDQLDRYAHDPRLHAPFLPKLDLTRIGALGHSAGGEAAASACQTDHRLKACLNQDGVMHNLPFSRDSGGRTMSQPFMYIGQVFGPPRLSDAQRVRLASDAVLLAASKKFSAHRVEQPVVSEAKSVATKAAREEGLAGRLLDRDTERDANPAGGLRNANARERWYDDSRIR